METLKLSAVGQSAGGIEILQALRAGWVGDPAAQRTAVPTSMVPSNAIAMRISFRLAREQSTVYQRAARLR